MFLEFNQFMTSHFGHPGTVAMREIESQPIEFTYKNNPAQGGRRLRAFVHPLNAASVQPVATPQTTPVIATVKPTNDGKGKTNPISKSDVLAEKAKAAAAVSETPGKSDDHSNEKNPLVADDGVVETIDAELAKTMKAKAFGEKYKPETMRAWLAEREITLTGKESATQLAKIIIDTINTGTK